MAVKLRKGQKIDLTKTNPGLKSILIGLGWDISQQFGQTIDLDASVFICNEQGKVSDDKDFVYYNNPNHYSGGISYSGDNRTGSNQGDDEVIVLQLDRIPNNVSKIAFSVTIYDANLRRQNFGMVNNAYIRIVNMDTNEELMKFDLGRDFSVETAVVIAEIYRHGSEWKFNAIGSGFQGGLGALCRNFGLDVEDENEESQQITTQPHSQNNYNQNQQSYNPPINQNYNQSSQQSYTQNQQQVYSQQSYPVPINQNQGNFVDLTRDQYPSGGQYYPSGGRGQAYPLGGGHQYNSGQNMTCPRCSSGRVSAGKKGFRLGQAAVGALALGPVGLLGGLIGANKMEFACLDCGQRWNPNEGGLTDWINSQVNNSRQLITSYGKNTQLADALVASSVLVATADGRLEESEKNKMIGYFRTSRDLQSLDINYVINRFNELINKMNFDVLICQDECFREIVKVRNNLDVCRLVVRFACAIGYADGHFSPVEQQMVRRICGELYLNPQEFIQ